MKTHPDSAQEASAKALGSKGPPHANGGAVWRGVHTRRDRHGMLDDSDLYFSGTGDVESELCKWFGDLSRVVPAEALAQLEKIKRTYEFAFGD